MSYLFKQSKTDNSTVFEIRLINYCVFIIFVFLSLIPAIIFVDNYIENINIFRIFYVLLILIIYALLGGNVIIKVWWAKNVTRQGSIFSIKNPLKFIINNK